MKSVHLYSLQNLGGDYIRSISGAVICLLPLAIALGEDDGISGALLLFPFFAALFGLYLANTVIKQLSSVRVDDQEISITGLAARTVKWEDLSGLKLSYFTTWRGGEKGWMQLRLKSPTGAVCISSSLTGFADIVQFAVRMVDLKNLSLDDATLNNLNDFGFADRSQPQPREPVIA